MKWLVTYLLLLVTSIGISQESQEVSYVNNSALDIFQNNQCVTWPSFHQEYKDQIDRIGIRYDRTTKDSLSTNKEVTLTYFFKDQSIIEISLQDSYLQQLNLSTEDISEGTAPEALAQRQFISANSIEKMINAPDLQNIWLEFHLDRTVFVGDSQITYNNFLMSNSQDQKERQELCGNAIGRFIWRIRKLLINEKDPIEIYNGNRESEYLPPSASSAAQQVNSH